MKDTRIVGIGVDIENISRFRAKKFEENQAFYQMIFTEKEIEYCLSKADPYPHFTARFCAKEAVVKALATKSVNLKQIEVIKDSTMPKLQLNTDPNTWVKISSHLSLSHTKEYAVASVIILEMDEKRR